MSWLSSLWQKLWSIIRVILLIILVVLIVMVAWEALAYLGVAASEFGGLPYVGSYIVALGAFAAQHPIVAALIALAALEVVRPGTAEDIGAWVVRVADEVFDAVVDLATSLVPTWMYWALGGIGVYLLMGSKKGGGYADNRS